MSTKLVIALCAGAVLLFGLVQWMRADYIAFDAQREAWHRRCDAYLGKPATTPAAQACADELQELMAYAERKGWR